MYQGEICFPSLRRLSKFKSEKFAKLLHRFSIRSLCLLDFLFYSLIHSKSLQSVDLADGLQWVGGEWCGLMYTMINWKIICHAAPPTRSTCLRSAGALTGQWFLTNRGRRVLNILSRKARTILCVWLRENKRYPTINGLWWWHEGRADWIKFGVQLVFYLFYV